MADASQNNPKKELSYALIGLLLFLGIVLLIGISAYLRPAGEHIEPVAQEVVEEVVSVQEVPSDSVAIVDAEAVATEATDTDVVDADVADTEIADTGTAAVEPDMSAEESVAANVEPTDTLVKEPSTGNLRSDDVVVTESMELGGEEAPSVAQ